MTDMKFDGGKPRLGLITVGMPRALIALGEVATFGAGKYAAHSWLGVDNAIERYTDAKVRHLVMGVIELRDDESGLLHAAHEAWNALAVLELKLRELENES